MKSDLDPELLEAYLSTDYFILDDPPIRLNIGEANPEAEILLASFGVESGAFITAWNPGSKKLSSDENEDRQAGLLAEIELLRLNYMVGVGEREDWQEYSYLILGATMEIARELAEKFEQNAFVWIDHTGMPELITLK